MQPWLTVVEQGARDLMPILVADLADDESRSLLEAVAYAGGEACVPLVIPPMDTSVHVLEVYSPGFEEAMILLAEPMGAPTPGGFVLRLKLPEQASGTRPAERVTYDSCPAVLRPRHQTNHDLSEEHAAALDSRPPPPMEEALVGRTVGGKLAIEKLIGSGGVGAVYRGVHQGLRMPVAVKVLHPRFQADIEFCQHFHAEALAASRLDHPNLVRVIDFGQEPDGLLYFAMEFLDGKTLRDVLEDEGVPTLRRSLDIMIQVCTALAHAHARGVIHRDLKPENVVLVASPDDDERHESHVKICDFGLAAAGDTEARVIAGTPEYMSPEQCAGELVDARSDIYACGVMLYELVSGRLPFEGDDAMAVVNRQMHAQPEPPSKHRPVDARIEQIIMRALDKDPERRQESARALRRELREILAGEAPHETAPPPAQDQAPPDSDPQLPVSARPAWMEDNTLSGAWENPAAAIAIEQVVDELTQDQAGWLRRFAETRDPKAFAALANGLEKAVPTLAERGFVFLLWSVASTCGAIAGEGPQTAGSRPTNAHRVLAAILDEHVLRHLAEGLLRGGPAEREALRLLAEARVGGAYALYGVRAREAWDRDARGRFSAAMRALGANAWPVIRAALDKLAAQPSAATLPLVDDLLASAPDVGDDAAGDVVARYLGASAPATRAAATLALMRAWGRRASPMFVSLLQDTDDAVRAMAVSALAATQSIDEHVARRLFAMLTGKVPAGEALLARIATALAHVVPAARNETVNMLSMILAAGPTSRLGDATLYAIGQSIMRASQGAAGAVLVECAGRLKEPLRSKLMELTRPA
jgi:serine/threonine-protein kinase